MGFFDRLFHTKVQWYCDNCGDYMNDQDGFNTSSGTWDCTTCGFENDVTPANIEPVRVPKPGQLYQAEVERIPCAFDNVISRQLFEKMAIDSASGIDRLKIRIDGSKITGVVTSMRGTSDWRFYCDFNDCGRVTGNFHDFYSENTESRIPVTYVKRLIDYISDRYKSVGVNPLETNFYCPKCGALLNDQHQDISELFYWKCKKCGTGSYLPPHLLKKNHF